MGKRLAVTKAEVRREDRELVAYGTATFAILSHIKFNLKEVEKRLESLIPKTPNR